MDFSFDVANFLGGLGSIDEDEFTTEAIVKLSEAGWRSDEGCSCGMPALMNRAVSELQLPTCPDVYHECNHGIIESPLRLKRARDVADDVFSRVCAS